MQILAEMDLEQLRINVIRQVNQKLSKFRFNNLFCYFLIPFFH